MEPLWVRITWKEQAQSSPTPAKIFSLFYKGKLITTDLSICTDKQFSEMVDI